MSATSRRLTWKVSDRRFRPQARYAGRISFVVRQVGYDIVGMDLARRAGLNVLKRNPRVQGGAGSRDASHGGSPSYVDDDVLVGEFHLTLPPFFCPSIIF